MPRKARQKARLHCRFCGKLIVTPANKIFCRRECVDDYRRGSDPTPTEIAAIMEAIRAGKGHTASTEEDYR